MQILCAMFTAHTYRNIFFAFLAFVLVFQLSQSHRYGVSWDEEPHLGYGDTTLAFYKTLGTDTSSFRIQHHNMFLYGAFVESTASVLVKITGGEAIRVRHLYFSFWGFLLVLFVGLMVSVFDGWRGAVLGALFMFFSPVLMGHSHFNSKDVPLAVGFAASFYFLLKLLAHFPTISWRNVVGLVIAIGVTFGIRVTALLFIGLVPLFFLLTISVHYWQHRSEWRMYLRTYIAFVGLSITTVCVGFFIGLLCWPYGLLSPIKHTWQVLSQSAQYSHFNSYGLYAGNWINNYDIPWHYLPTWIWITAPPFVNIGLVLLPLLGVWVLQKKHRELAWAGGLLFSVLFPIMLTIVRHSNIYDGWRHFYFLYPALVTLCALVFVALFSVVDENKKNYLWLLLLLCLAQPTYWMLRYHPLEAFYFSPVIGGTQGAFKKYDIDYYGTSIKNAVDWIAENSDSLHHGPNGKIRIRCYYGERFGVKHAIAQHPKLEYVECTETSDAWDYNLVLPVQAKLNNSLLLNWDSKRYKHEIKIGEAVVIAIAENNGQFANEPTSPMVQDNTPLGLVNQSLAAYNRGDYVGCVTYSEKCLLTEPCNKFAWNNLASALYLMQYYSESIAACKQGLACDTSFALLKKNLKEALKRQQTEAPYDKATQLKNAINLSATYYNLGKYEQASIYALRALQIDPKNLIALNNLGSAYNSLGRYTQAKQVLEQALRIDRNYQLAKNNLRDVLAKMNR